MTNYSRSIDEIRKNACLWWPKELTANSKINVTELLAETHDGFLSVFKYKATNAEGIAKIVENIGLKFNIFLKHLVVLSDFGGEQIQRLNDEFSSLFKFNEQKKKFYFEFSVHGTTFTYEFKAMPTRGTLGNKQLYLDSDGLNSVHDTSPLMLDISMVILYGALSVDEEIAGILNKCDLGAFLGRPEDIEELIRKKYIFTSRITSGAKANNLGQSLQAYVKKVISTNMSDHVSVRSGKIQLDGYDKPDGMPFDLIVENGDKKVGLEVSFQVTTNSTIERKAGQAESRQTLMHRNGYKIGYIIDGAGNFKRSSAISTICAFSDCTVSFSEKELQVLIDFLQECFND